MSYEARVVVVVGMAMMVGLLNLDYQLMPGTDGNC